MKTFHDSNRNFYIIYTFFAGTIAIYYEIRKVRLFEDSKWQIIFCACEEFYHSLLSSNHAEHAYTANPIIP